MREPIRQGPGALTKALKRHYPSVLVVFVLLLVWQAAVWIFSIPEYVLPSPITSLGHLFVRQPDAFYNWKLQISTTVSEVLISFAVTAAAGILLAILIAWSCSSRRSQGSVSQTERPHRPSADFICTRSSRMYR